MDSQNEQKKASRAFKMYLLNQPPILAARHIYKCLRDGTPNNEAWVLLEEIEGEKWTVKMSDIKEFLLGVVEKLRLQHKAESL